MNQSTDYKRVFDHFDEDRNGVISPSELQRCVGLIYDDEILVEELQIVIDSLQGSDGQLGFEDFISLMESEKEEEKLEDLKKAFGMYEMDGTDCITPMSLNQMLSRLGESTSVDECVGMIHRFDLNGDGVLNFDEFRAMMI
ncbi:hypothetical protein L1987_36960 [Smallanthus sonchifolius]|uniref:Uncharacterized protein n=1 Tax=Smallanthus sonchifolius TaxID=185202 RepID=A0ACB9HFP9_9ASTR|nr:hypothetical protein L1987_36960 [Smallanthus sonchifolius]